MDLVVEYADEYLFDALYSKVGQTSFNINGTTTTDDITFGIPRDNIYRQTFTSIFILTVGGFIFYLFAATMSYYFVYDHNIMKHPKFLKNQIRLEIECALSAMPGIAVMTAPWIVGELRGHSYLYGGTPESLYDWAYFLLSIPAFLAFTDCGIYWIHRWEHHPLLYKRMHKLHHKWIVPTPFASHAFKAVDGYAQSLPYHIYVFLFPMHKYLYLGLFIFVNFWTVMIHDGAYISHSSIINTSAHHAVHHLYFNYNYGQYFTLWDRIGNSHRQPTDEQYDSELRINKKVMAKQAKDAETIEDESERAKLKSN
ncbi:hypothetical protein J3Q64DRAFT_1702099 [Phycomyces blakesleeanus]|uniref:Fatty acid hydroxylase domain-containing protein n=2 Tax=Phycomyces blakesleeanus TaxID=4837 RepID=A0A167RCB9_PHYB8|nr:hypothetical protein PHYBLDRAFT_178901 [Phycomyces blakesleeanus NRRL 1555(-)]OAD81337.1 hypothetical protein PHYBLDRAFT_178901 [Phycomyces blakesleeanus NRRL 1555(-)]UDE22670.1 C-5 sterol desaturase [Phycomyces blakesleeanus]|eukprot:XP_018299377.1 hypothetical protein PHYBLDRAFT_178901 [Phycomyces blakesleeanus NRRL 1555(-)]